MSTLFGYLVKKATGSSESPTVPSTAASYLDAFKSPLHAAIAARDASLTQPQYRPFDLQDEIGPAEQFISGDYDPEQWERLINALTNTFDPNFQFTLPSGNWFAKDNPILTDNEVTVPELPEAPVVNILPPDISVPIDSEADRLVTRANALTKNLSKGLLSGVADKSTEPVKAPLIAGYKGGDTARSMVPALTSAPKPTEPIKAPYIKLNGNTTFANYGSPLVKSTAPTDNPTVTATKPASETAVDAPTIKPFSVSDITPEMRAMYAQDPAMRRGLIAMQGANGRVYRASDNSSFRGSRSSATAAPSRRGARWADIAVDTDNYGAFERAYARRMSHRTGGGYAHQGWQQQAADWGNKQYANWQRVQGKKLDQLSDKERRWFDAVNKDENRILNSALQAREAAERNSAPSSPGTTRVQSPIDRSKIRRVMPRA